jgi:hypothetical protein
VLKAHRLERRKFYVFIGSLFLFSTVSSQSWAVLVDDFSMEHPGCSQAQGRAACFGSPVPRCVQPPTWSCSPPGVSGREREGQMEGLRPVELLCYKWVG